MGCLASTTEGIRYSRILRPCGENDAAVVSSPVCTTADSGLASTAMTTPDLVPTTFRLMGNVVYLHAATGKFLMEVGSLSSSELGMKPDLGAITATENEADGSAGSYINLVNNSNDHLIPTIEDASIIRTAECYGGDQKRHLRSADQQGSARIQTTGA
jgi:hypothetical protein